MASSVCYGVTKVSDVQCKKECLTHTKESINVTILNNILSLSLVKEFNCLLVQHFQKYQYLKIKFLWLFKILETPIRLKIYNILLMWYASNENNHYCYSYYSLKIYLLEWQSKKEREWKRELERERKRGREREKEKDWFPFAGSLSRWLQYLEMASQKLGARDPDLPHRK